MTAPVLVLAVGNPSRGDDALGPLFAQHLEAAMAPDIRAGRLEVLTDFQLNVEHALDLAGRREVVFVDASTGAPPPFSFTQVAPKADRSFTSHALSPSAVLETWNRIQDRPAPPCFVLELTGHSFELGAPLTPDAADHLETAKRFFEAWWLEGGPHEAG